ncbi:hypothetical protein FB45DRAFT_1060267 [Roridomyces roridus]|uniref:F-box domain-containing protein n=1 Tax=Roridomyces roridus TaxID=1738132 RepID=A0AAD7BN01_9AGAR|nr:hypothetical protein FB45DRAFT_1060267 [Roridomyces roridus]
MASDLPPELVELIFDHFHPFEDRQTLQACSLVCKSWLAASRVPLFADISLHQDNIASFCHVAQSSRLVPIQTCIRRLTLEYIEDLPRPASVCTNFEARDSLEDLQRLGPFPGVKILRLEMSGTVLDRHAVVLGMICPNLSTLDIDAVNSGALSAVLRAVAAFPSADTLRLRRLLLPTKPRRGAVPDTVFFRGVLALDALPKFSSLCAWNAWPHARSALGDYLRRAGTHIQHICLDAYLQDVSNNSLYAKEPIAIAHCTGLQSLRISAENLPHIALRILPLLAAPSLSVISLEDSGACFRLLRLRRRRVEVDLASA